jgi:hypothetical protein
VLLLHDRGPALGEGGVLICTFSSSPYNSRSSFPPFRQTGLRGVKQPIQQYTASRKDGPIHRKPYRVLRNRLFLFVEWERKVDSHKHQFQIPTCSRGVGREGAGSPKKNIREQPSEGLTPMPLLISVQAWDFTIKWAPLDSRPCPLATQPPSPTKEMR